MGIPILKYAEVVWQSCPVYQFAITNTHNHAITETLSLMLNFFLFSNNTLSYLS